MKLLSLFAAACLFSSLLAAQTTTSIHGSGFEASADFNVNGTIFQIGAFRGDTSTLLFIFSVTQNPNGSTTSTAAFGMIPDANFVTTGGLQHMSLNVDTSQVPGFTSVICTPSTGSCTQGPLGLLQLDWENNRITALNEREDNRSTLAGSLKVDLHRDSDGVSANASGSYLGISLSAADLAFLVKNRDTTITITR